MPARRAVIGFLVLVCAGCGAAHSPGARTSDAALSLVREHGWEPQGPAEESAYQVPQPGGLPFVNLQDASDDIGLDLHVVAGKVVRQKKYLVGKTRSGYSLFACVLVDAERPVGAWISTDGPAAPGIWSLGTSKSHLTEQ